MVDAPLPPALAHWLAGRGHCADHVVDLGLAQTGDIEILKRAIGLGVVVVSKDADFARLAAGRPGAQVLWLRFGNATSRDLIDALAPAIDEIERALAQGQSLVEVAR